MVACTLLHQAWQSDGLSEMAESGSLLPLLLFFLTTSSVCHRGLPFPGPCPCAIFVYNCQYACTDHGTRCSYLEAHARLLPACNVSTLFPVPNQPCLRYKSDTSLSSSARLKVTSFARPLSRPTCPGRSGHPSSVALSS